MTEIHLIDTHCHLNFHSYDEDRDAVIERANAAGVRTIIIPGIDPATSREALDLAKQHSGIYAAVGVHPNDTVDFNNATLTDIAQLAHQAKVIAIGEIGLDYYWDKSPKSQQQMAFEQQLTLATQRELPVIIHNREASEDTVRTLEQWVQSLPDSLKTRPGVMHSFSGTQDIAERALAIGFYLGFTGPITFNKADELRAVAAAVPLDRILVETDGPFLTPHPYRGKRNESAYIPYIVERIAALHNLTPSEMGQITTENAQRLFQLDS